MEPSRFDYVKYDEISAAKQARLKALAQKVEAAMLALDAAHDEFHEAINREFEDNHSETSASTACDELRESCLGAECYQHLEQAYMWCGKAIRDEQIARNGSAELQDEGAKP